MRDLDVLHRTVYVTIGNSDNKLTQQQWALFCAEVNHRVYAHAARIFGTWYSLPNADHQSVCWGMLLDEPAYEELERDLTKSCANWQQDSIAFATAKVKMIRGDKT